MTMVLIYIVCRVVPEIRHAKLAPWVDIDRKRFTFRVESLEELSTQRILKFRYSII